MSECANIDCEAGRQLGCQTFCCRLLVRLEPDERKAENGGPAKAFVEKNADGYCVNLDRTTFRCAIWAERPRVCRAYECNSDPLLQAAVRYPFKNIAELAKLAATAYIPKETYLKVPPTGN